MDSQVRLGLGEHHLDPGIRPLVPFSTMVGTAVTLRLQVADEVTTDLSLVGSAYDQPADAHDLIIVFEIPEALHPYGIVGGHAATNASNHGFVGALVDGGIRDTHELARMQFPVFSRTITPGYINDKAIAVDLGQPVQVGGRTVNQDDIIVADNDGVLVIPAADVDRVLEHAQAIRDWEDAGERLLNQGMTFAEVGAITGERP